MEINKEQVAEEKENVITMSAEEFTADMARSDEEVEKENEADELLSIENNELMHKEREAKAIEENNKKSKPPIWSKDVIILVDRDGGQEVIASSRNLVKIRNTIVEKIGEDNKATVKKISIVLPETKSSDETEAEKPRTMQMASGTYDEVITFLNKNIIDMNTAGRLIYTLLAQLVECSEMKAALVAASFTDENKMAGSTVANSLVGITSDDLNAFLQSLGGLVDTCVDNWIKCGLYAPPKRIITPQSKQIIVPGK